MTDTLPIDADLEKSIRAAGLRVTAPRLAVLTALQSHPHTSADTIYADVEARAPGTALQSVYNALSDFVDAGLVRRIQPAGQPMRFEARVADNHHHLVCTSCGHVEDVDCVTGEAPCLHPADSRGFAIAEAEVTFWGMCASCRNPAVS
ncbi:fur family transcriptional regulator FurA3 [Microbacterium sediminicola]|uniref:Fur family transcriptional regulator FurA3 n=1 Tax=Microbacterium sediminicola TaxID=415210 RepID=A0ABP4TKH0_9MICO